jgi:hypothetical protein
MSLSMTFYRIGAMTSTGSSYKMFQNTSYLRLKRNTRSKFKYLLCLLFVEVLDSCMSEQIMQNNNISFRFTSA